MRSKILRFLIILFMTSFLFSCREGETGLSIAMAQEPPSFDVMVNTSISGREILVGNVFEKLLAYDEGEIVPLLAESYSSEDDGCTLRFRIRKGVLFHDGSPMTVSDAVASMNRWLSYSDAAEKIVKGSRFTVDGNDIVITSTSTLSLLPALIATSSESAVIFRASDIPSDGGIITSEIGTGPYKVLDYSLGEKISLGLFDEYHGEKPSISRLDYYFVSDPVTRRLGLESGTYDFIDTVSSDDIPVLSGREEVNVISGTENGSIALLFNKKTGISSSHDFRKGVSLLINRDELMKACRNYFEKTGRRLTFEYSLVGGENDSQEDAEELAHLIKGLNCHINLIPVNPIKERSYVQSDKKVIANFQNKLEKYQINVTIRREMGRDIDGACGQLRKSYIDKKEDS